jgi:hypothetical protein
VLAHHQIAHAAFAELAVHVFHEEFGQPYRGLDQAFVTLHPHQHQRQDQGDHVEPPGHRIGHAAIGIPFLFARNGHHAVPQRAGGIAIVAGLAQQAGEQGHGRASFAIVEATPGAANCTCVAQTGTPPLRTTRFAPKACADIGRCGAKAKWAFVRCAGGSMGPWPWPVGQGSNVE